MVLAFVNEFALALLLGIALAVIPHEGAHWVVAKCFSRDVSFEMDGVTPNVQFHSPYEVPKWGIRISGVMPFLLGSTITLIVFLTQPVVTAPTSWSVFWATLGITTAGCSLPSGGDWLAVFAPEQFQKYAAETTYEAPSFREAFSMILRGKPAHGNRP